MSGGKDDPRIVKFMALFQKLREMNDDPHTLEKDAAGDEGLRGLCLELGDVGISISISERQQPNLFAAPVDPKFISCWREYESSYQRPLAGISLSVLAGIDFGTDNVRRDSDSIRWENADAEARENASAIEGAIDWAQEDIENNADTYPESHVWNIQSGVEEFGKLQTELGFDLRGVFRRRALIPFILIPRHVARKHGDGEKLSLFDYLKQAHDAFIFGAPFAAIALMRAVMEIALKSHYQPSVELQGRVELEQLIESARGLRTERIRRHFIVFGACQTTSCISTRNQFGCHRTRSAKLSRSWVYLAP